MILCSVYFTIISILCIRFIWIISYFINKKQDSKQDKSESNETNRIIDLKLLWTWTLVALNSLIRIAIVVINIPLIIVSYGGLNAYVSDLSAAMSVIVALTPVVDILTALSLLYLYHVLGLKQRRLTKTERFESLSGLVN
jgi:hypothetical protein